MSNYRAGAVIRLTRKALGISQEKLCEDICSVHTLFRIENGKVHVKRRTYEKLMERMGRDGFKVRLRLTVTNPEILDLMEKVDAVMRRHEYGEGMILLDRIRLHLDLEGSPATLQWLRRRELYSQYHQQQITGEALLSGLENLLALTVRDYESLLDKVYPFWDEEMQLLMNIAIAYSELKEYEKAIRINCMLLRSLDTGYMLKRDAVRQKVVLLNNTGKYYGCMEEYEEAIRMKWEAIRLAKENGLITVFANGYAGIAMNMLEQIRKGERKEADKELCRQYFRMGYAAAAIAGNTYMKNFIREYYAAEHLGEDIYTNVI